MEKITFIRKNKHHRDRLVLPNYHQSTQKIKTFQDQVSKPKSDNSELRNQQNKFGHAHRTWSLAGNRFKARRMVKWSKNAGTVKFTGRG
jgi:hypothetical protein